MRGATFESQLSLFPTLLMIPDLLEYLQHSWTSLEQQHPEWAEWDAALPGQGWSFRESILVLLILRDIFGLELIEPMQDTRLRSARVMHLVSETLARPFRSQTHVLMNRVVVWRRYLSRPNGAWSPPSLATSTTHDASISAVIGWTVLAGRAGARSSAPCNRFFATLSEYQEAEALGDAIFLPISGDELLSICPPDPALPRPALLPVPKFSGASNNPALVKASNVMPASPAASSTPVRRRSRKRQRDASSSPDPLTGIKDGSIIVAKRARSLRVSLPMPDGATPWV